MLSVCLAISFSGAAQSFSLGIKAGALASWGAFGDRDQKDTFSTKLGPGYTAGFQIGFPLKNNYLFLAEAAYTKKTRRLLFNADTWENRSVYQFAEATMLLRKNFKFYLKKNVPSEWFFSIGPEISYWLTSKGKIIVNPPGFPYEGVFDKDADGNFNNMYYHDVNRYLFSLVVGVGFKAPMPRNQHIATELRFVSGHTHLGTKNSSHIEILGYDDTLMMNLKSINLVVTYTFDFNIQQSRKGKSTLDKKIKRKR